MNLPAAARNRHLWLFAALWLASFAVLALQGFPLEEPLAILALFGAGFPLVALLLCWRLPLPTGPSPAQRGEAWLLLGLLAYVAAFLAMKGPLLALLLPDAPDPRLRDTVNTLLKLAAFVAVPLGVYAMRYGRLPHAGAAAIARGRMVLLFGVLAALLFGVSLIISNGARALFELSPAQQLLGLLLCFAWMTIEAGIVEEVFFRWLLQSRLAALTGSQVSAVFLGALAFGVAHAPGFWLRGSGVSEGLGEAPDLATSFAYSVTVQAVAGLLFGVLWARTRKLWLVVALHATLDAASNAAEFVHTWGL
jgi:membrane protease YdiL (CAAX protease family)